MYQSVTCWVVRVKLGYNYHVYYIENMVVTLKIVELFGCFSTYTFTCTFINTNIDGSTRFVIGEFEYILFNNDHYKEHTAWRPKLAYRGKAKDNYLL